MRKRSGMAVLGLLAAMSLAGASAASAATEFGDACAANDVTESTPITLFEIAAVGNPLPTSAPSAGVITRWKVNVIPAPVTLPQTLKVLRPNAAAKTAQIVGEDTRNVSGGLNSFETRIPVQAGDRLGLFGPGEPGTLICESTGAHVLGVFAGGGSIGATVNFAEIAPEARVPVSAVIEPDVDNDGYGDETQDKCPQSAAAQTVCPVIVLDAIPLTKKGSVVVLVAANPESPVTVSGAVKAPGKSKGAKSSAQLKLKGVTSTVKPGAIARITLPFSAKLKSELAALPSKRSVKLTITASATNAAGQVSTDTAIAKLKGQAPPQPKR